MSVEVLYEGILYRSASEFCDKEHLSPYSAVLKALNDGWASEDIVNTYGPNAENQNSLISFKGKLYKSLAQASMDIGSCPSMAYTIRKKHHFTAEETLQYLVDHKKPQKGHGKKVPICVEGVYYKSQTEAANAYHLSRATITSRMERDGLSFEEALIVADRYRKHMPNNTNSILIGAIDTPMQKSELPNMSSFQRETYAYLKESFFTVSVSMETCGQPIFTFPFETKKNKTITCQLTVGKLGNELYVPSLLENVEESIELYQAINAFNRDAVGSKIWMNKDHVSATWNIFTSLSAYGLSDVKKTLAIFLECCSHFVDSFS